MKRFLILFTGLLAARNLSAMAGTHKLSSNRRLHNNLKSTKDLVPRKSSRSPIMSKSTKASPARVHANSHLSSTRMPSVVTKANKKSKTSQKKYRDSMQKPHAETLEDLAKLLDGYNFEYDQGSFEDIILSPSPSSNAEVCRNRYSYITSDGKSCSWIRGKESRRQNYCTKPEVRKQCPQACGLCCDDDPQFDFIFKKTCRWLESVTSKTACEKGPVKSACPIACGLCVPGPDNPACVDDNSFVIKTRPKNCNWVRQRTNTQRMKVCNRFKVRNGCPVTCGFCQEIVKKEPNMFLSSIPSNLPTARENDLLLPTPSKTPSASPSSASNCVPSLTAEPTFSCFDDPTFKAPFAGDCGCELFNGTDCLKWSALLDANQLEEVFRRCPVSCGLPCRDDRCIDDITYRSPANKKYGCEIYDGDCLTLWALMLDASEIEEAIRRCPNACGTCSQFPSTAPSSRDSLSPSTGAPTRKQTLYPTLNLSDTPSVNDSNSPNTEPALYPLSSPSTVPSMTATRISSSSPTGKPAIPSVPSNPPKTSLYPSTSPTEDISTLPSFEPSLTPSRLPIVIPSVNPSRLPTLPPSYDPSSQPSEVSTSPTEDISTLPSFEPSLTPSRLPSVIPSALPTLPPSYDPSSQPSEVSTSPTEDISTLPSFEPSLTPSRLPSVIPSANPSGLPTLPPLYDPSSQPSEVSTSPTEDISTLPSFEPSSTPSQLPSVIPSSNPRETFSLKPSERISTSPTEDMTSSTPSRLPSWKPSQESPTSKESHTPSILSNSPNKMLSTAPTITAELTQLPTVVPTYTGSALPSLLLNDSPNFSPTVHPSITALEDITSFPTTDPSQCSDSHDYRSPINPKFGCNLYCDTDCHQWGVLLNATSLQEVFTKCPITCKVPCGYTLPVPSHTTYPAPTITESFLPSLKPSQYPFVGTHTPSQQSSTGTQTPTQHPSTATKLYSQYPSTDKQVPSQYPSTDKQVPSQYPSADKQTVSQYPSSGAYNPARCSLSRQDRNFRINAILQNVTSASLLFDNSTAQGKARQWLIYDDEAHLCPDKSYGCPDRLIQRYALAVLYFSTGGDNWATCSASDQTCGQGKPFWNQENFMSASHECLWAGIGCLDTMCARSINFENNNMTGSIPSEVSTLRSLEWFAMEQGQLSSTIPSSIAALTNLLVLDLDYNILTGNLPQELFTMTSLRQLDLNNNTLVGPINGIENLKSLEFIQLHGNGFSGAIPTELNNFVNLTVFTSYDTNLTGQGLQGQRPRH